MCLVRNCRDPRFAQKTIRLFRSSASVERTVLRYVKRTCPAHWSWFCMYSTHTNGGPKVLTDEISKEKPTTSQPLADDKPVQVISADRLAAAQSIDDSKTPGSEEKTEQSQSSEKKSGRWTGKNAWKLGLVFLGGWSILTGGSLVYMWGGAAVDPEGNEIEDEFSHLPPLQAMIKRATKEFSLFTKKIQEPSREKLLPDPLQYPYMQPPYTLVLEMTGVLVHPDWTYSTGWRFKKRPGIDYFLHQVGPPLFEIVIYSQEQGLTADPLVSNLDPQGYVMYRLYRDATRYMNGHHIKDLGCLNRELSKVIMVDWNPKATELNSRNALLLQKWTGNDEDRTLIDLAHFLKTIATSGVEDVRTVLEYYSQFDDPIAAFKNNQRKLQEEQERLAQQARAQDEKKSKWGLNFLRRRQ